MGDPESASLRPGLDVRPDQPIRVPFERIFKEAETAVQKGRWFEHLFMAVARDVPDFQVADIWPWRQWPDLDADWSEAERTAALRWALARGGRSGRTALHFAKDHVGGKLLTR